MTLCAKSHWEWEWLDPGGLLIFIAIERRIPALSRRTSNASEYYTHLIRGLGIVYKQMQSKQKGYLHFPKAPAHANMPNNYLNLLLDHFPGGNYLTEWVDSGWWCRTRPNRHANCSFMGGIGLLPPFGAEPPHNSHDIYNILFHSAL